MADVIIKTFTTPRGYYVYDRETNSLLNVLEEEFDAFRRVEAGEATEKDWLQLKRYTEQGYLKETVLEEIEHPASQFMRDNLDSGIEQLTMCATQLCGLRCSYCTYSGNYEHQRSHSDKSMSLEMMKKCVDFIMARSRNIADATISFYGGEPLLAIENIIACIEYVKTEYQGRKTTISLTSNGVVFNEKIIRFLEKNDVGVAISLDGPKHVHDKSRVFADGKGSFDTVISNLHYIRESYPEFYDKLSFLATAGPGVNVKDVVDFYNDANLFSNKPITLNTINSHNSKFDVYYDDLFHIPYRYQVLKKLLAELGLYSNDKLSPLFANNFLRTKDIYKSLSGSMRSKSHPGGPCLPGIMRPFVDVSGNIFACEKVSEESQVMIIGHIDTGFDYDKVDAVLNVGRLTESVCKKCWAFNHCNLCVAACDGGDSLSAKIRLENCYTAIDDCMEELRKICLLMENEYNFSRFYHS